MLASVESRQAEVVQVTLLKREPKVRIPLHAVSHGEVGSDLPGILGINGTDVLIQVERVRIGLTKLRNDAQEKICHSQTCRVPTEREISGRKRISNLPLDRSRKKRSETELVRAVDHGEVLVHSERRVVLEGGVAGITDRESTIHVDRHVMREVGVDRDSHIGRTKILRAKFDISKTIEGETKRVHHTRTEHIVMSDRDRIEHVVATRGSTGQWVLRDGVRQGNELLYDGIAPKDILLGVEFIIEARRGFMIVLAERDSE